MENVEVVTKATLLRPDGLTAPIAVRLEYLPTDPYAVMLIFLGQQEISWLFARDLLNEGQARHTGLGDVRIWPGPRRGTLVIALSSPDGNAVFEFSASAIRGFLQQAYARVSSGRESDYIDLDKVIMDLFQWESEQ